MIIHFNKVFIFHIFSIFSVIIINSRDYTHLGFGVLRRVNGLGLVKLRFYVTLRDAVTQLKTPLRVKYN